MNWTQLLQTIDPAITDESANHILWERTCYPFGSVKQVYKHASSAIRAHQNGICQCELCSNKVEQWGDICPSCGRALVKNRQHIANQEKAMLE